MTEILNGIYLRLLLVDDDGPLRMALSDLAQSLGHKVISFDNGSAAFDYLKQLPGETFDLAFIDYHMPLMNGIELIDKMLHGSLGCFSQIILFTGDVSDSEVERFAQENENQTISIVEKSVERFKELCGERALAKLREKMPQ